MMKNFTGTDNCTTAARTSLALHYNVRFGHGGSLLLRPVFEVCKHLRKVHLFVLAFLLAASGPIFAADKPIDVLIIGLAVPSEGPSWQKYKAACAKEGVRVSIYDKSQTLDYSLVTDDYLRQFHVVLFANLPGEASGMKDEVAAAFRERLDAYHKAGGGVLWVPASTQHECIFWNKLVGERYDVQCLEEELYDPGKTIDVNAALGLRNMFKYIWTTNIAEHPVTKNVKGLFLPSYGEYNWPATVPMKFGKSWTVLIKGMESTRTMGNAESASSAQKDFKPEVKGTYDSAPEIVGVRDGEGASGRMMVFPFYGAHTYLNFGHEAFNDAMMLNGFGGQTSEAHRLLINSYKWLAEPAMKAGLGGYKPLPPVTAAIPAPLDWSKAEFPPNSWGGLRTFWNGKTQSDAQMTDLLTPNGKDFKGIFGARTVASDGQGSVADYVKAAKEQGLSFIVFLETLEKLDETKFAKLVADCAAVSNESFAAIPGYIFRDETGILYYFFGVDKLPVAENLTADRRVKGPYTLVDQFKWTGNLGVAELGKLKINPNYLFLLTCAAPYVYDGTKLVDDGLAAYLSAEGHGHQYAPNAIVQVTSPEDMAKAVNGGAKLTVLHAETLATGLKTFSRASSKQPTPAYITSGPAIVRWGALNPIGHPFFAGKQRVRFVLEATSDAGIAEIKIINANTGVFFRHFKPNGGKSFSCTIDETHQRQWSLVPIVTDVNGRTALAGTLQTYQDGNRLWMMGDRLMGMHHALSWDPSRKRLVMETGWVTNIPWTKGWSNYAAGPPTVLSQPRGADSSRQEAKITGKVEGIDGGNASSEGSTNFNFEPAVITDFGKEPKAQAYRFNDRLASFDVAVMDHDGSEQFAMDKRKDANGKWLNRPAGFWPPNPDPQIPMETADIQERTIAVHPSAESTISANIHEIVFNFKKDIVLKKIPLFSSTWEIQHDNLMNLLLRDGEGDQSWMLDSKSRFLRDGALAPGGYLYPCNVFGGQLGVINLGPQPLDYAFSYPRFQIFISGADRKMKAGEKIVARFINFVGPKGDASASSQWLKKFVSDFGVGADKPGYPFTVRQGKLRSSNYIMELQPENGGATVDFGKYALPHNLLVALDGFAANAVAGRYDLDKKQLLILPVFEYKATTSVNTTRGENKLYIGELFHCDNQDVRLSCVQDGTDKLLLELHNPTDKALTAKLTAVPGFAPLAGLNKAIDVPVFSSVKLELPVAAGSLVDKPYEGD